MEKKEKTPTVRGGIGYWEALSLIMFTLKLLGVINVSWWLVFAPILINWVLVLIAFALVLILGGAAAFDRWINN